MHEWDLENFHNFVAGLCGAKKYKDDEDKNKQDKRILVLTDKEVYAAHWVINPITDDEAFLVALLDNEGNQALVRPTHWMHLPGQAYKTP